jgi:hypothetical protein
MKDFQDFIIETVARENGSYDSGTVDCVMEALDIGIEQGYDRTVEVLKEWTDLDNFQILKIIKEWKKHIVELEKTYA